MTTKREREGCHRFEVEIAAAGREELAAEVADHVEGCPSCSRLRAEALALARQVSGETRGALSPAGARALARRALDRRGRRVPLWVAPLLSASASAAALILWFGLLSPTQESAVVEGRAATAPSSAATLELSDDERELPDSLRAVSEVLIRGRESDGEAEGRSL